MSLRCTLLADLIGVQNLTTGFGMMSVLDATGVLLGPASAGNIFYPCLLMDCLNSIN